MNELKREIEVMKEMCKDPGLRANWICVGIMLGVFAIGGIFVIGFLLSF